VQVLDYTASPLGGQLAKLPPVDLVFDAIGTQSLYDASPSFLKPEGLYVSISLDVHNVGMFGTAKLALSTISNFMRPTVLGGTARPFKLIMMHWSEENLQDLAKSMDLGNLTVPVDSKYASDREGVMAAYEKLMSNKVSLRSYPSVSGILMISY
jgi:NADPH:quinone reductase-like Zn-dependent oxidoreductase